MPILEITQTKRLKIFYFIVNEITTRNSLPQSVAKTALPRSPHLPPTLIHVVFFQTTDHSESSDGIRTQLFSNN